MSTGMFLSMQLKVFFVVGDAFGERVSHHPRSSRVELSFLWSLHMPVIGLRTNCQTAPSRIVEGRTIVEISFGKCFANLQRMIYVFSDDSLSKSGLGPILRLLLATVDELEAAVIPLDRCRDKRISCD